LKRKWTNIERFAPIIMRMRSEVCTRQQVADALGLKKAQIKTRSIDTITAKMIYPGFLDVEADHAKGQLVKQ
jgi:hypothetical protein